MAFTNSSVPFFRHDRPAEVIADGKRLDGRDNEEFRTLCKLFTGVIVTCEVPWQTMPLFESACAGLTLHIHGPSQS